VIVYDTSSKQSFDDIESFWMNEVESYADKQVDFLLLGNKCDLFEKREVDTELAKFIFIILTLIVNILRLEKWNFTRLQQKLQITSRLLLTLLLKS
jgi:GTPase SAR1 family protein